MIGLTRLATMLKHAGRFHLMDVVHTFDPADYVEAFDRFVQGAGEHFGQEMVPKAEATIREEFPTFDWIMEEITRLSGFQFNERITRNE